MKFPAHWDWLYPASVILFCSVFTLILIFVVIPEFEHLKEPLPSDDYVCGFDEAHKEFWFIECCTEDAGDFDVGCYEYYPDGVVDLGSFTSGCLYRFNRSYFTTEYISCGTHKQQGIEEAGASG